MNGPASAKDRFATPRAIMRWIMAAFFLGGGVMHFVAIDSLVAITPDWVPSPRTAVLITGVLELAGAVGLLVPRLRWWAGVALALYILAVWPANIKHAMDHIVLPPIPDSWWYHGPRLVLQPVLAWWALFCAGVIDWPWRRTSELRETPKQPVARMERSEIRDETRRA